MANTIKYHFYLKDKDSNTLTPINLVYYQNSKRKKKGIGESISPEWWDATTERAIESNEQTKKERALSKRVNKNLNRLRAELDGLFEEYNGSARLSPNNYNGDDIQADLYKRVSDIVSNNVATENEEARKSRVTPTEFFTNFIDRWSKTANKRTMMRPSPGTIWNYKNTLRRYSDYINDRGLTDSFKLFNSDFQSDFDDYLASEQSLSMNTISSTHSQMKTMLSDAYKRGLLKDNSFMDWTSKCITLTHVYLKDEEIKKIYALQLTDKLRKEYHIGPESKILESRDLFVVASRTGLRFSDLKHLNMGMWDINNQYLTITVQKTSQLIKIPLHKEVIEIYNKYNGKFPAPVDKSHYNEEIRLCAKIAGLNNKINTFEWQEGRLVSQTYEKWQLISSHTARRSFATNLYLQTKSAQMVMSITGHRTEENFRRYICVDMDEMAAIVKQYINLDYDDNRKKIAQEFLDGVRKDAVTIDKQKKEIEEKDRQASSERQRRGISEMEADDYKYQLKMLKEAWGMGITLKEYEEIERKQDEISRIVDNQDPMEDFY